MYSANGLDALFAMEWMEYLEDKKKKKVDLPSKPSPGWLAEVAAKNNLCTATWKVDGDYVVCGAELWKNKGKGSWLCKGCEQTNHAGGVPEVEVKSNMGAIGEVGILK